MSFMNVGPEGAKRATDAIFCRCVDALAVGDADELALVAADSDADIQKTWGVLAAAWLEPIAPRR